tara:strand:- start:1553 stop:1807 length:255 start_codon:yes stop_codon:yes gene_type:complete
MSDIDITKCIEYDTSRLSQDAAIEGYKTGFTHALNNEIFTLNYYYTSYQLGYKKGYGHGSVARHRLYVAKEVMIIYKGNTICVV